VRVPGERAIARRAEQLAHGAGPRRSGALGRRPPVRQR
jgi:hypothetical protein